MVFINSMTENKLKIEDTFVIFYYGIFKEEELPLHKIGVKIHYLCTWHDILKEIKEKNLFEKKNIESIEKFLFEPDNWKQ